MIDIDNARAVFMEYVKDYDMNDGKIALKVKHILRVSEISRGLAIERNLSEEDVKLAEIIGLLHDIGRFEQIRVYNTFYDKNSVNHGEYGVKLLFEDGLIEKFNIDEKFYRIIKLAILNHNRCRIEEGLSERELLHAKIIRDSDKLDIYGVLLNDSVQNTYECESLENEEFSDEIVREFKEDKLISYKNMKTNADLWIAHIAYVFDFYFKESYIALKEKSYVNELFEKANFKNIKTINTAKEVVDIANKYIEIKCL